MRDNVLNGAVWDDMGFLLTLIWEVFLGSNRMSNYPTNTIESTVLLCILADVECTLGGTQGSRSYATYPHALSPHWPFVRIKETNDNNVIFVLSNFWEFFGRISLSLGGLLLCWWLAGTRPALYLYLCIRILICVIVFLSSNFFGDFTKFFVAYCSAVGWHGTRPALRLQLIYAPTVKVRRRRWGNWTCGSKK